MNGDNKKLASHDELNEMIKQYVFEWDTGERAVGTFVDDIVCPKCNAKLWHVFAVVNDRDEILEGAACYCPECERGGKLKHDKDGKKGVAWDEVETPSVIRVRGSE